MDEIHSLKKHDWRKRTVGTLHMKWTKFSRISLDLALFPKWPSFWKNQASLLRTSCTMFTLIQSRTSAYMQFSKFTQSSMGRRTTKGRINSDFHLFTSLFSGFYSGPTDKWYIKEKQGNKKEHIQNQLSSFISTRPGQAIIQKWSSLPLSCLFPVLR